MPCVTRSSAHDLVITTYGTLRTDIAELSQLDFDYLILDEAQCDQERGQPGGEGRAAVCKRPRTAWR